MRHRERSAIHISVDPNLYNRFVHAVVPAFYELHPGFLLEHASCNAREARRSLLDGTADLGFYYSASGQEDFEHIDIATVRMYLAFPRDYQGTADLSGLRRCVEEGMFIVLHPVGSTLRMIEEQQLAAHQICPRNIMQGNAETAIRHIAKNNACGFVMDDFCTGETKEKILLGSLFCTFHRVIAFSGHDHVTQSPECRDLVRIITQKCSTVDI